MFQPINDINLEDEQWFDHNPLDGSQIGGAMPKEYELVTDIPGQPHAIMLAVRGGAYSTMEAYCPRPNFVSRGFGYALLDALVMINGGKAHILEFDLIRSVRMLDGSTMHFDGSLQVNIANGWMLNVDSAAPGPCKGPTWLGSVASI